MEAERICQRTQSDGGWLDVRECVPEPLRDVLIALPDDASGPGGVEMGWLGRDGRWYLTGSELRVRPTHWRPLPAPPWGSDVCCSRR